MNSEIFNIALLFTSAFVGATIAFLAALIVFPFHYEIRELLVAQGLIVPAHESRPNPALQRVLEHREPLQHRNLALLRALEHAQEAAAAQRADHQNNQDRQVRLRPIPFALAAFERQRADPWAELPDPWPRRLETDGTIWAPHPQYL